MVSGSMKTLLVAHTGNPFCPCNRVLTGPGRQQRVARAPALGLLRCEQSSAQSPRGCDGPSDDHTTEERAGHGTGGVASLIHEGFLR